MAFYLMFTGRGLTGEDYGAGSYYYTDIPDWQTIFYPPLNHTKDAK